jgi:hypothetical protein
LELLLIKYIEIFKLNMSKIKVVFIITALLGFALFSGCQKFKDKYLLYPTKKQLDKKYASAWNKPEYQQAHTAKSETYLTEDEKEVFYYLNLVRLNPALFAETYADGYRGDRGVTHGYAWDERKASLLDELSAMEPLGLIYPDTEMYELARCFAYEGGKLGIVGHDRSQTGCPSGYHAEGCDYGAENGLSIVIGLLIDAGENNAALGHRRILLSSSYDRMGVSIQPHKGYRKNAVLDFKRK